ncbi:MAG: hypothetical protein ABID61_05760 [Candidatus Micrarchaeota archaeon]
MERENKRQLFHILIGLVVMMVISYLGRGMAMGMVFFTIIIGLAIMNTRLLGKRNSLMKVVAWFENNFERNGAPLPGWGSACYATGILIAITILVDQNEIMAIIMLLALGDGFSTLIGRHGKIRLPHNNKKTLEGSIAFVIAAMPAYFFIGPLAIPLVILGAIIETLPLIDDNLMIPIIATAFLVIF